MSPPIPTGTAFPSAPAEVPTISLLYPSLGDYMGLELSEEAIAQNMPEYALATRPNVSDKCRCYTECCILIYICTNIL